jgi:hypothetical protein
MRYGIGTASIETSFQRGHTGVSALWGTLGLVLLVVGLRRASRPLRLGGFFIQRLSQGGDGPVAQA